MRARKSKMIKNENPEMANITRTEHPVRPPKRLSINVLKFFPDVAVLLKYILIKVVFSVENRSQ